MNLNLTATGYEGTVARARNKRDKRFQFVVNDTAKYSPTRKFDLILLNEYLCDFSEPLELIQCYREFLEDDGKFVFSMYEDSRTLRLWRLLDRRLTVVYEGEISIGQSVLFQELAMGKPVVTKRVAGTEDSVEHGRTGRLAQRGEMAARSETLWQVTADPELLHRPGSAWREQVHQQHLPDHYAREVISAVLRSDRTAAMVG